MGKLAEMAGANVLTGPVTVTAKDGSNTTYKNEEAAEAACGGKALFHHRGAFYERGCTPRGYKGTLTPRAAPPPPTEEPTEPSSRRKKTGRRRTSDDE